MKILLTLLSLLVISGQAYAKDQQVAIDSNPSNIIKCDAGDPQCIALQNTRISNDQAVNKERPNNKKTEIRKTPLNTSNKTSDVDAYGNRTGGTNTRTGTSTNTNTTIEKTPIIHSKGSSSNTISSTGSKSGGTSSTGGSTGGGAGGR